MYRTPYTKETQLHINTSKPGEMIETKVERLMHTKEPLTEGQTAPLIYTPRAEGIRASTNIRTDRFEIALEATDKIAKSYKAKREERAKAKQEADKPPATTVSEAEKGPKTTQKEGNAGEKAQNKA